MTSNIPVADDKDILFMKGVSFLQQIKLVRGGQAVYATLRKRKVLKNFLDSYIRDDICKKLDDLEECIVDL